MTEVASPMSRHPGPMSRDPGTVDRSDSEDSVEKELDWLIQRAEAPSPEPVAKSYSPRASPRGSPRSPPPPARDDDDDHYVPERPKSRTGSEDDEDAAPEYDGEDFDMSQMTDDQRQAMIELQHMKLDLAYTTDEEPPEYDVTERLRQLNAELEQEPMPEDDARARSIKFHEDPVSLVVPPPTDTFSDTEDDQTPAATDPAANPADPGNPGTQDMADTGESERVGDTQGQRQDLGPGGDSGGDYEEERRAGTVNGAGDAPSSHQESQDSDYSEDWPEQNQEPESVNKRHGRIYPDNHDYEEAADSDGAEGADDEGDNKPQTATASEEEKAEQNGGQSSEGDSHKKKDSNDDSMVLVERNGKFEHLHADELTAEERELYGVQTEDEKNGQEEKKSLQPKPPSGPRPATAGNNQTRRGGKGAPRSTSAMGQSSNDSSDFNYRSPYAMTDEERKRRQKEQNEQERQKREEEKARKEQEERDKADAEDAFQAWLSNKRKEAQEKKKQEKENQKKEQGEQKKAKEADDTDDSASNTSSFQERDNDSAFNEWLKVKKGQKKEQQEQEKKMMREHDEGYYVRSRTECNRAFKEWLKKKNSDLKRQQQEEMAKARVHKLLARKSRKSQQLARAIKQAQAFKYVDYYGYRY